MSFISHYQNQHALALIRRTVGLVKMDGWGGGDFDLGSKVSALEKLNEMRESQNDKANRSGNNKTLIWDGRGTWTRGHGGDRVKRGAYHQLISAGWVELDDHSSMFYEVTQ